MIPIMPMLQAIQQLQWIGLAKKEDANLIVYPELALTTFFPRWYFEKQSEKYKDKIFVVDYKNTLMGGGFQISNPNANKSCGCGQSFS